MKLSTREFNNLRVFFGGHTVYIQHLAFKGFKISLLGLKSKVF